ncbi:16S rRNA (cytosine(1402)-N(4))-methyltransferase RsmH [Ureaplasma diversum]|uniref:Ribosomal RNA small subunit methyltransferase H n=1 Tax=Ureaplasma diversum NCTC 246 TaxID=1188241 RepID=A0A084EXK6_9BACT|nr:16S rRNA (cytosine(1402)-N(4))-methyltransferase RsmH [Ureaplasma diversum]KEZ22698.1 S-adenosyl-methyltransferase [Ureaplasma diversum NCTC 246]
MDSNYNHHISVLLEESINILNIKPDGVYVDCTLGRCGHSKQILNRLNDNGLLICFDQDQTAIDYAKQIFANQNNVIVIKSNFKDLKKELIKRNITKVDGFIFDLGLSSPQLDDPNRGFSYQHNARLDMRMDQSQKLDAHYVINNYSFQQLCTIFSRYGEIKNPKRVVDAIIQQRQINPINTTFELVDIIKQNSPLKLLFNKKHPARLYFQAIRIEVNSELSILEQSLNDAISLLNVAGIIAVISFHSLEDRITKKVFSKYTKNTLPKEVPISNYFAQYSLVNNKTVASEEEINANNRSRSSILRAMIKNY